MRLRDAVVLITGGSRGLGREIARTFAQREARLILTARGVDALRAAAEEVGRHTEVLALPGDIADPAHAGRIVRAGLARFGRIDVLINNASTLGPTPLPPLDILSPDALQEIFQINVAAPLRLIHLVLPQMKARRQGVIINVTSDAAIEAYPGWGGYGVSKAALEHLSRVLAVELEGTGVRVYVVDPGDMNTQMHRDATPDADLSDLPGPEIPAPAFAYLVEEETAPFGRFQAQRVPAPAGPSEPR